MSPRPLALGLVLTAACASYQPRVDVTYPAPDPLAGPRVVAFIDTGSPTASIPLGRIRRELTTALERAGGFGVARFVNADVPYGLDVRGHSEPCDDGFRFEWIEIEIIDLRANRRVYSVRGEGATEGCLVAVDPDTRKVTHGTLLRDLSYALAAAWGKSAPVVPAGTTRL